MSRQAYTANGGIDASDAIQSLLVSLGDEHRERIHREKFVSLCLALEYSQEEAEDYWLEMLDFCGIQDDKQTWIDAVQLETMYHSNPEYNPSIASANLLAKLKQLFSVIDSSGDENIELDEFVHGDWKHTFADITGADSSDSVLQLSDETLQKVFEVADFNHDGKLDFAEFCVAVLKIDKTSLSQVKSINVLQSTQVKKTSANQKVFIGSSMSGEKKVKLKEGIDKIMADKDFGARWLIGLFDAYPETRALFANNIHANIKPVMDMLYKIVEQVDHFEEMLPRLQRLGVKHVQMKIKFEYFEHLLYAMLDAFEDDLVQEERQMWVDLFALIYYTMMTAKDVPELMSNEALKRGQLVEGDLDNPMLDPTLTGPSEFVRYIKQFALTHAAVNHSYLTRFGLGDFPDSDMALCIFLREYQHYGKKFVGFMNMLLEGSTNEEHKRLLEDDLANEQGRLEEENLELLAELGVDPATVDGVPHKQLFLRMSRRIHEVCGQPVKEADGESGAGAMFATELSHILTECDSHEARAAALGIATECLVPTIYKNIINGMQQNPQIQPPDYLFLLLHTQTDVKHGDTLEGIVADLAATSDIRGRMFVVVKAVLEARCRLWDRLLSQTLRVYVDNIIDEEKGEENNGKINDDSDGRVQEDPEALYDANSQNWSRKTPNCLSDFTARPVVFDMCRQFIKKDTWVLDLGCGEGYCARALYQMGPEKLVGLDVSAKMIDLAKRSVGRNDAMHYFQGDATDTLSLLKKRFLDLGVANQTELEGRFGLIVAVFLFNYMTIDDMNSVIEQVTTLLKPGGRFIFTVPHPSLRYWHRRGPQEQAPFHLHKEGSNGYFEDRDYRVPGVICTKDGKQLQVQSMHKTLSDYFQALSTDDFVIEEVKELGVDEEMMKQDPAFFGGVQGVPLHVAFRVIKTDGPVKQWLYNKSVRPKAARAETRNLQKETRKLEEGGLLKDSSAFTNAGEEFLVPPKEVLWSAIDHGERFVLKMPPEVVDELVMSAKTCMNRGIDHTNYVPGDVWPLTQVKRFGLECANRLMRRHGNLIVQGLDIDALAETELERERLARLCYYILMTCVGNINETRGRLFDVKDRNLDVRKDNVLFSASSQECGWHTDGSSKDWFPDMVCLLCIRPALAGGEFQIANACNAYYELCTRLPQFLMYELVRPTTRDIIEKGASSGFGASMVEADPSSFWTSLSRQPQILSQRIRLNSYPIFERNEMTRQSKFRYLDHWMLSGHKKANLRVSPLLKMAMKELEKALDRQCRFDRRLDRGEIAMGNNHLVAHRRNAFNDPSTLPEDERRLLVRCWLKVKSDEDN